MNTFFQHFALAAPLFLIVFFGFVVMRVSNWPTVFSDSLNKFVFTVAMPIMLFRLMCDLSKLPPVDARLLIAFFGGCLIVFVIGRIIAYKFFRLDGTGQSVFAMGGIFSNNVLLGLPVAKITLGNQAVPSVALVLVFNALILWSLITISIEWSKHGNFSIIGFAKTVKGILKNPVIIGIFSGALVGISGLTLPVAIDQPVSMLAQTATPLALFALGMGLAEYGIKRGWQISACICGIKLIIQPLAVWILASLLKLPPMESKVVVLLASMSVGANVYLMSHQFKALEGPIASSLVLSTILASITTPLMLTLIGA